MAFFNRPAPAGRRESFALHGDVLAHVLSFLCTQEQLALHAVSVAFHAAAELELQRGHLRLKPELTSPGFLNWLCRKRLKGCRVRSLDVDHCSQLLKREILRAIECARDTEEELMLVRVLGVSWRSKLLLPLLSEAPRAEIHADLRVDGIDEHVEQLLERPADGCLLVRRLVVHSPKDDGPAPTPVLPSKLGQLALRSLAEIDASSGALRRSSDCLLDLASYSASRAALSAASP